MKAIEAYSSLNGRKIVAECTVIEGFLRQTILIEMLQKGRGALVRLFHGTSPEKTHGVRLCLAWIATGLMEQHPDCTWETRNLGIALPSPGQISWSRSGGTGETETRDPATAPHEPGLSD